MAGPTGLEPAISSVTGRRVNHFTTDPSFPIFELAHYTTGSTIGQDRLVSWVVVDTNMVLVARCRQPVIK